MGEPVHEKMREMAQEFQWRISETHFLEDAVQEAIRCWRFLMWTYPIAYYLKDKKKQKTQEIFKAEQGKLEMFCDGLQSKLDFEMDNLGYNKTREEIIAFTRTARQRRNNLSEYID